MFNICDLKNLYNETFQYSLPEPLLQNFFTGNAFDNPSPYSEAESRNLQQDIQVLFEKIISLNPVKAPLAIISAGAPASGKTVKLRQEIEQKSSEGIHYAYICPDDVCLQNQIKTYQSQIEQSDKSPAARKDAYNKWRPASNAATHLLLGNLIRQKYAFYFGSTSSSPATGKFFEFLKKQGYQIRLIHLSTPDRVRRESLQERDKAFIQANDQDFKEKGWLVPQRINDTFLKYADEIEFYSRDGLEKNALLAARWTRLPDQEGKGALKIIDPAACESVRKIQDQAAQALHRPDLTWSASVGNCSILI